VNRLGETLDSFRPVNDLMHISLTSDWLENVNICCGCHECDFDCYNFKNKVSHDCLSNSIEFSYDCNNINISDCFTVLSGHPTWVEYCSLGGPQCFYLFAGLCGSYPWPKCEDQV
jgi:hypothetical protein